MLISDWISNVFSSALLEFHRKIVRVLYARAHPRVKHHAGVRREADPDDGLAIDVDRSAQGRHDVTSASIGNAQAGPIDGPWVRQRYFPCCVRRLRRLSLGTARYPQHTSTMGPLQTASAWCKESGSEYG